MKKILLLVLGVMLVGSLAFGQTQVLSRNAVGYVKVDVPSNGLCIVALGFFAFSNTVPGVMGDQLIGGGSLALSDQIWKWDPNSQGYIKFWKNTAFFGAPGKWVQSPANTVETTNKLYPYDSFWIKNNHSNQTIYVMGEVPDSQNMGAPSQTVWVAQGLNMLGYTFPVEVAITNLNIADAQGGGSLALSDQIWKWDSAAQGYIKFWKNTAFFGAPGKWVQSPANTVETTNKVYPGQGVWYKRLSTSPAFPWSETKPYTWPL